MWREPFTILPSSVVIMPSQKEIIHLTFGTLSHHITTHFFNQQASHFEYPEQGIAGPSRIKDDDSDEEEENPLLFEPAVDFQEGIGTRRSQPTFFPRQVVIDFKHNLGTAWDAYNVVVDDNANDEEEDQDEGNGYSVLQPSKAANEGYHAWNDAAEVQWVGGTGGKVKSTRLGPILDVEGDDYYEDSDEDEYKDTEVNNDLANSQTNEQVKPRKLLRTV
jgi:Misato Segment II tubulin-like domain